MLKSRIAIPFLILAPLTAGCGGGITVQVLAAGADAEPVANLEVQFLPFDRDSLFAALGAQASSPEPTVPEALQQAADSAAVLQEIWRSAEANWNAVRDSLRTINDRLEGLDRRGVDYRQLFDRFNTMEGRERSLDRQRQSAFEGFTGLQEATQVQLDSVKIVIASWEEVAFADYGDVESDLLNDLGRGIAIDTTNADGVAFASISGGPWWVYTRVNAVEGELYWNVMIPGASSDTLRLQRGNAELRRVY